MNSKKVICPFCKSEDTRRINKKMMFCNKCKTKWSAPSRLGTFQRMSQRGL